MKKEDLVKIGLDEDQMREVFKLSGIQVENVRQQMAEVEQELEQIKEDKVNLEDKLANNAGVSQEELEQAKADLVSQLESKDAELAEVKNSAQEEINKIKFNSLLESQLKDAGAKNIKATLAVMDLDSVELNEEGKLEGLNDELERVLNDDSTKFLFGGNEVKPAFTQKRTGASNVGVTKSTIMSIKDPQERQQAIKENIELFK